MSLLNSDEHLDEDTEHRAADSQEELAELADRECALEGESLEGEGFVLPAQPPQPTRPSPRRGRFLTNLLANVGFFGFNLC